MIPVRGYWWGAWLFGLAALACVALLPHAIQCCSHFSQADLRLRAEFGPNSWSPIADALLDWPTSFRLLLLSLVAFVVCFAATLVSIVLQRSESLAAEKSAWKEFVRFVLACIIIAVLYILAIYATGLVGYLGPLNLLWMLGVPAAIAVMISPRPLGIFMAIPLTIGGWVALAAISIGLGIPVD